MIKNEDTYCTVQHKIVREIGACEAVVYGTIQGLLRKTDGYGGVSNQTIMDMCGMNRKSLSRYIDKLIQAGYIEKVSGDGRGNISIYYISKKGDKMTTFSEEKGGQNDPKRGTNLPIKGDKMTPINKGIIKEINKGNSSLSSFDGSKAAKEEEDKIFIEEENINNSVISPEDEQKALEDVKKLFAQDEIGNEIKITFEEFWKLFNPDEDKKCMYKVALGEWNRMEENWRAAAITLFQRGARTNERNPYFFLQHFRPTKYFLNEREQYDAYKQGTQLCRVRWGNGCSRVMAALFADVFKMEILDDHYEKRFEI